MTPKQPPLSPLVQDVVGQLRGLVKSAPEGRLPSLRQLSQICKVSRATAAKALKVLAGEGLVVVRPRARAWSGAPPTNAREKVSAVDALYRQLSEEIAQGRYRARQPLPKVTVLAEKRGLSNHTVSAVYARLVDAGLAWKMGRTTMAGPPPAVRARNPGWTPTIVVLTPTARQWDDICSGGRYAPFGLTFVSEAESAGVRLAYAAASCQSKQLLNAYGIADTLKYIRNLDSRYIGMLIAGHRHRFDDLDTHVETFSRCGRPVVWFDPIDGGRSSGVREKLFRCSLSEEAVADAAIRFLAERGHRRIYYAYDGKEGWQTRRLAQLQSAADRAHCSMELFGVPVFTKDDWLHPESSNVAATLQQLHAANILGCRRLFHDIAHHWEPKEAPSVVSLPPPAEARFGSVVAAARAFQRRDPDMHPVVRASIASLFSVIGLWPMFRGAGATALIAPNDRIASIFHLQWIFTLGLRIPQDISILSFDNTSAYSRTHLSSVDGGFGNLGYRAFHLLCGDVPVQCGRDNQLRAQPFVVDRGSVRSLC